MKKQQQETAARATEIRIQALDAQEIFLAGSFNDWNPSTTRMERDSDGSWVATVSLTPGRHEYKFVVDGTWCCNPGGPEFEEDCPGYVRNPFGTLNCIIDVSDETATSTAFQAEER